MDNPPPELIQGIAQFNRQEYFEAHETLEAIWRRESGPVRLLYQGVIQVAVGLLHAHRGNHRGAVQLLDRGIAKLDGFPSPCLGIDVASLRDQARRYRDAILALGPERIHETPADMSPVITMAAPSRGRQD